MQILSNKNRLIFGNKKRLPAKMPTALNQIMIKFENYP